MWPILCRINGYPVPNYLVFMTMGAAIGTLWLYAHRRDMGMPGWGFWAFILTLAVSLLVGARLGFIVLMRGRFWTAPWEIFLVWKAGRMFWSGLVMASLAAWLFIRAYSRLCGPRSFLKIADHCAVAGSLWLALGRLGCLAKGCCYGHSTTMPWGMRFTSWESGVARPLLGLALHPTQLYEAVGAAAIACFLACFMLPRIRTGRYAQGAALGSFLILCSVLRFCTEFYRGDYRGGFLLPGLSPSQWSSIFAGLVGAALLWKRGAVKPETAVGPL